MANVIHQDQVYKQQGSATVKAYAIWLSDLAYAHLVEQARRALYVKMDAAKPRGYTAYLRALFIPTREWRDTRPPWLVERSLVTTDASMDRDRTRLNLKTTGNGRLTGPRFPLWWDPDDVTERVKRVYRQDDLPLGEMLRLAIVWGITSPRRSEFQFEPHLAAGNVLEAVGRGMLTANVEPSNPNPGIRKTRRDKHPYVELVW